MNTVDKEGKKFNELEEGAWWCFPRPLTTEEVGLAICKLLCVVLLPFR